MPATYKGQRRPPQPAASNHTSRTAPTASAEEVPRQEHHIRRPLRQPPHEVRIPGRPERDIDPHAEPLTRQPSLQVAAHAIQHLELERALGNYLLAGELPHLVH